MKRKFLDLENTIRHSLKVFGIRVGNIGRVSFEAAVRQLVAGDPLLASMMDSMLRARAALWQEYKRLHTLVVQVAVCDPVSRRFMGVPGIGPVTALAFRTAIDEPGRFARSRNVGAYFGLTPKRFQSGTSVDWDGRISRQATTKCAPCSMKRLAGCSCAARAGRRSRPGVSRSSGGAATRRPWLVSPESSPFCCMPCGATAANSATAGRQKPTPMDAKLRFQRMNGAS